ncbi:MAG: hypothetical protein SNJ78_12715 [Spirochaetales bacterium]
MGTGAANPDLWIDIFGVDTEHVYQLEIIRRAELVNPSETERAFQWLILYLRNRLRPSSVNRCASKRELLFTDCKSLVYAHF